MKLYFKYFSIHMRSQMQYKISFLLTTCGQLLTSFSTFLTIYFMMSRFHAVEGFTYSEVLLCFGIVLMAFSTAECFARGFDLFPGMIGNGEFDRAMVRPRSVMFQVLASKIEFSRLGRLIQGAIVFIYALATCGIFWTVPKICTLIFMLIGGVATFTALFIIYASFCFFTLDGLEFMNIFTDGGREFGKYPFAIYGKNVLRFFTYIIPLALFQYYPLLFLLGRSGNMLFMVLPLVSMLFLIPANAFWRFGIRRYKSTGS